MNLVQFESRNLFPAHVGYIQHVIEEMKKNGFTNIKDVNHIMMYPYLKFVFAAEGDTPLGMFACSIQQETSTCYVLLAYVNPDSRKKGVFKAILDELKRQGAIPSTPWSKILFGVFMTNKTMQQVMRASGASAESTTYSIPTK